MNKKSKMFVGLVVLLVTAIVVPMVLALPAYDTAMNTVYGTPIGSCGICHINPAGGGPRTPYGDQFAAVSTHTSDPAGALIAIGPPPGVTPTPIPTSTVTPLPKATPTSFQHPFGWDNPIKQHKKFVKENGPDVCLSCHSIDPSSKGQAQTPLGPSCWNCHGPRWEKYEKHSDKLKATDSKSDNDKK